MRYEKGRKDASRRRIMEVAAERFRDDGIAGSGLASIMSEAGLTNGAFYPHFDSKAELVRECVGATLDEQSKQLREALASGGLELFIAAYLSPQHRDNPRTGCASAALLAELAREPSETRQRYTEGLLTLVRQAVAAQPLAEGAVLAIYATLIGTLQMARAVEGAVLSDRILAAGADAARALIQLHRVSPEAGPGKKSQTGGKKP